ncbi:MAG TPA: HAMP domain-containing sensor histidine kinase, partial [Longimicrobiaceae bacterium]|nr:HAMP domain-containing sensor histidine kinase [Longimicrobiaceae bacterium]
AEDPDLQGVLITFRDVTERIEALEAARRAGEARDEFLARMSHELRTPLHAVLGWAQLLTASEDRTTAEAAEQIADAGRFLLRLVNDSLDLAAVQEGRIGLDLRAVDVRDAVDEVIELVRPLAAEKDITVRAHVPPGLTVRADADRLRQILLNLLGNAVKFSRYAGEVVVTAAAGAAAARISVEDSGAGIKPENLGLLFERYRRFETLNAATPGTGLGLAIARKLTELMEGTIGVDSSVGEGATFWIELPVATDERSLRETGRRSVVVGTTRGA